jgi:hypothetical protein
VEGLNIPKMDPTRLISDAFDDHERHGGEKRLETATQHDINHITLNYIRHQLIPGYNKVSFEDPWKYFSWFARVNRKIAAAYPFLKTTVEQQIGRKESRLSVEKYITPGWEELQ